LFKQSYLILDDFNHSDYLDDLENLNMPDSPSALENSFLMAQRYIHKQQQVIYRQNAAVAMGSLNCGRQQNQLFQQQHHSLTINNVNLHQINKIMPISTTQTFNGTTNNFRILKTADTNQFNMGSVYANPIVFENGGNLVKPWTSSGQQKLQQKQSGNDLNLIMSRLNINKPQAGTAKTGLTVDNKDSNNRQENLVNSESSESDTESDSSDSLSFLKENLNQKNTLVNSNNNTQSKPQNQQPPLNLITNTPPVKLQNTSKGVVNNIPGDSTIKVTTQPVAGQFNMNPVSGMSVSYAFMKNSNQVNPNR